MHLLGVITLFVVPGLVYLLSRNDFLKQSAANALYWYGFVTVLGISAFVMWILAILSGMWQSFVLWTFILFIGWYGLVVIFGVGSAIKALSGSQGIYFVNRHQF